MVNVTYARERTALLFVDPYNDFLSDGGKLWPMVKDIASEVGLLDNLRSLTAAIRRAGIQIFIVPHRRWGARRLRELGSPIPVPGRFRQQANVRQRKLGR